jgi:DbpA RNA binding domain.
VSAAKKANKLSTIETVRIFINVGKKDNLNEVSLMQYVAVSAGLSEGDIQSATLLDTFSFLEVVPAKLDKVLMLSGSKLGKHLIAVEVAGSAKKHDEKSYRKAANNQKYHNTKSSAKKCLNKKPYEKSFEKQPCEKKGSDKFKVETLAEKKPYIKKHYKTHGKDVGSVILKRKTK